MRLDGGRYDRLVRQMERATSLPVVVAEAGQQALPGQVHFVPPTLGVAAVAAKWMFEESLDFDPAQTLLADDSAVLFLSAPTRRWSNASPAMPGLWPGGRAGGRRWLL